MSAYCALGSILRTSQVLVHLSLNKRYKQVKKLLRTDVDKDINNDEVRKNILYLGNQDIESGH